MQLNKKKGQHFQTVKRRKPKQLNKIRKKKTRPKFISEKSREKIYEIRWRRNLTIKKKKSQTQQEILNKAQITFLETYVLCPKKGKSQTQGKSEKENIQ